MSYTATFDASHKVKASGAHSTNFARHIARDADQAAGFSFAQRNENIDPARTSMLRPTRSAKPSGRLVPRR